MIFVHSPSDHCLYSQTQKLVNLHSPQITNPTLSKLRNILDLEVPLLWLNLIPKPTELVQSLHRDPLYVLLSTYLDFTEHIKQILISLDYSLDRVCKAKFV